MAGDGIRTGGPRFAPVTQVPGFVYAAAEDSRGRIWFAGRGVLAYLAGDSLTDVASGLGIRGCRRRRTECSGCRGGRCDDRCGARSCAGASIDLVVSDVGMPDVDGLAFARTLQGTYGQCAMVCITGSAGYSPQYEAALAVFGPILAKPVSGERLQAAARGALDAWRSQRHRGQAPVTVGRLRSLTPSSCHVEKRGRDCSHEAVPPSSPPV